MSIQDDFIAAGEEYTRRLDKQRETERLAALALEGRRECNANAFARAFEDALNNTADSTDHQE